MFSSQANSSAEPPFHLKVGKIERAFGCLYLVLIAIFSLIVTCCISCAGLVLFMQNQPPMQALGIIIGVFLFIFCIAFYFVRRRFKSVYGVTAVLNEGHLEIDFANGNPPTQIDYSTIRSVSIQKSKREQFGYLIKLDDQSEFELDGRIAPFPATNYQIENSIMRFVLPKWDHLLQVQQERFLISSDLDEASLRRGGYFWYACGAVSLFYPGLWSSIPTFFARGKRMLDQAQYCGQPFQVLPHGICNPNRPNSVLPFSECQLVQLDDVGLIIRSRISSQEFTAPICAENAFTLGCWLRHRLRGNTIQQNEPVTPTDDSQSGRRFGEGLSDLKSDLF